MALTVRKKANTIPSFDLEKMIKEAIRSMLLRRLSLRRASLIKHIEYFPTYTICEQTNDKSICSLFLKLKYSNEYEKIRVREIEVSGASVVEFLDYLEECGAKEISNAQHILEKI